jgi:2-methylcitrate dehydratase PrpD
MSSWASAVTIQYKDGSTESEESLIPKGDPKNPMSWEDTENKFYQLRD